MKKKIILAASVAIVAAAAVSVFCGKSSFDMPVKDLQYEKKCRSPDSISFICWKITSMSMPSKYQEIL